jgi:hypothetical protein
MKSKIVDTEQGQFQLWDNGTVYVRENFGNRWVRVFPWWRGTHGLDIDVIVTASKLIHEHQEELEKRTTR